MTRLICFLFIVLIGYIWVRILPQENEVRSLLRTPQSHQRFPRSKSTTDVDHTLKHDYGTEGCHHFYTKTKAIELHFWTRSPCIVKWRSHSTNGGGCVIPLWIITPSSKNLPTRKNLTRYLTFSARQAWADNRFEIPQLCHNVNILKCCDYDIWNHHGKSIQLSTSMPCIGLVICEIGLQIWEFCENKRYFARWNYCPEL